MATIGLITKIKRTWTDSYLENSNKPEKNLLGWLNFDSQIQRYWNWLLISPQKALVVACLIAISSLLLPPRPRLSFICLAIVYFVSHFLTHFFLRYYDKKWYGIAAIFLSWTTLILCIVVFARISFNAFTNSILSLFSHIGINGNFARLLFVVILVIIVRYNRKQSKRRK